MQCNLEISQLKPNSILYRNDDGKIVCVSKEEFLKDERSEIANLKLKLEQVLNNEAAFKQSVSKNLLNKEKEIDEHLEAIRNFIKIMKGEKK